MTARVRFCTWCKSITIYPGRTDDHVTVFVAGDHRTATVNAEPLTISDGVCEVCRAKHFPVCPKCKHPHAGHVCKHNIAVPAPAAAAYFPCNCSFEYGVSR
jgi:hypothetical protein